MKRARDENGTGSLSKRPANARGEGSGLVYSTAATYYPQTTGSALSYLKAVKDTLKDQHGKYDEFLEVMKDFKAQRINTSGVIARVKELFKSHRELIPGFNAFLPTGYEITLPTEEELRKHQPVEFDQAKNYVSKIKTRFQHNEQVYKSFLEILYMYRKGNKSISDVYDEVAALFSEHPDLLQEFTQFLPDHGNAPPLQSQRGNSLPHAERTVKEKLASASLDHDCHSEKHIERDSHEFSKDQRKRKKDKDKAKESDQEQDQEQENDLDDSRQHLKKRRPAHDETIPNQIENGVGEGFEVHSVPTMAMEDKRALKIFQKKIPFFDKVKSRLRSQIAYQDFIKCLNLYNEEILSRVEMQDMVNGLLAKHPDLIEGFNDFLTYCESNELDDGPLHKMKPEKDKEKEKDKERHREKDATTGDIDKEKDKAASHVPKEVSTHKLMPNKEKYMTKPISELDLSNCERCTPSYRLLPKNYPNPIVSHRTSMAHSVLNDVWVSVTSGSEDYSFKHMRKNQYEESLFRCEDDRFELDMLLESTAVTIKRMEDLLETLQLPNGRNGIHVQLEDHLTALNLRCVERIYGDHGLEIIDLLRKNAAVVLPVILSRLKLKQEEWLKVRADMNKVWAEVYAKNYHKSLDHSKQQDKKSLSIKALLAEIKEINEKKKKDDDIVLCTVVGSKRPLIPDLKFEYPDTSISDDLYRIIKYSADEMCSSLEQSDAVMRLWTTFLEPFFGVPCRPHGVEDTEEAVKGRYFKAKENDVSNGDSDGSTVNGRSADKKQPKLKHGAFELLLNDSTSLSHKADIVSMGNGAGTTNVEALEPASSVDIGGNKNNADLGIIHKNKRIMGLSGYTTQMPSLYKSVNGRGQLGERTSKLSGTESPLGVTNPRRDHISSGRDYSVVEKKEKGLYGSRRENKILNVKMGSVALPEREEGELSPSPEVEERVSGIKNITSLPGNRAKHEQEKSAINLGSGNVPEKEMDQEAEFEHDADADDEQEESARKTSEDSENASEPGEEVSGMSVDVNEFHGDRDEDDDEEEQQGRNESEGEAEMPDALEGEGNGTSLVSWDRSLPSCMPLAVHSPSLFINSTLDKACSVFYGNDTLYVLFRLHQTLYDRVFSAKTYAKTADQKLRYTKDCTSSDTYERFMRALYNLLDGSMDNAKFEDECRELIGTQSYVFLTLDKLIFKLVKQLQVVASDETSNKLVALYFYERSRPLGGFIDVVYHANACTILHDDNIYRFERIVNPSQLSVQLMEGGPEKLEVAASAMESRFLKYLNGFLLAVDGIRGRPPVFLLRKNSSHLNFDEHEAATEAMRNVCVANGLECKISCNNSKVSYVLDTEDFLHRRKEKKRFLLSTSRRLHKFHRWLDGLVTCDVKR